MTRGKARAAWETPYIHDQALFPIPPAMTFYVSGYADAFIFTPLAQVFSISSHQKGICHGPSSDLPGTNSDAHCWSFPPSPVFSARPGFLFCLSPQAGRGGVWCALAGLHSTQCEEPPSPPSPASIAELGGGPHSCPRSTPSNWPQCRKHSVLHFQSQEAAAPDPDPWEKPAQPFPLPQP